MATGFDVLAQVGAQNAERQSQYKMAEKDQEHTQKINDLMQQRQALVQKIPTLQQGTPEYDQAHAALQGVVGDIADFYHPQKNPGAIQNFGHLITDHMGITNPQDRAAKAAAQLQLKTDAAGKATDQQIAAAPATKDQQSLAYIQGMRKNYRTLNPNATPEQEQDYVNELIRNTSGAKPIAENFKIITVTTPEGKTISAQQETKSGKLFDLNGQPFPKEVLSGATVVGPQNSDTRARADFAADPNKKKDETFEEWKTRKAGEGRAAAPKPPNRDDKYIAIQQKMASGQPLTTDEKSFNTAYDYWVNKTKVAPGIARAIAMGANRYIPVVDPANPENVTVMKAADAANAHVGTPAGIAFQTDKALTRAFTSGKPADTINYFNTATEHLKQLRQAAAALDNGNIQIFNHYANLWATATGNPAPTNFATVKNAVAGELSKTFKGTSATDAEIDAINSSIYSSEGPKQLYGAIDNNINLMGSKMTALKEQYEAGKQGKPNFPTSSDNSSKPSVAPHDNSPKALMDRANKSQWPNAPAIGTVEDGHRYKGGKPNDPSSWEKVK